MRSGRLREVVAKGGSTVGTCNFERYFSEIQLLWLLQQISATMQKFEGMFEDLDVNTQVMSRSTYLSHFLIDLD